MYPWHNFTPILYRPTSVATHRHQSIVVSHAHLKQIAKKLGTTPLFTGTSDLDRLVHKQNLLLTVAGLKPVSEVTAGHWQETPTGRVCLPDDINRVRSFLDQLGLVYQIRQDRYALDVLVASDPNNLQQMLTTSDHEQIGRLFGYPATATSAFKQEEQACLPWARQAAILQSHYQDPRLIRLFCFRMSKQHYRTEMRTVEEWFDLLRNFNLLDCTCSGHQKSPQVSRQRLAVSACSGHP